MSGSQIGGVVGGVIGGVIGFYAGGNVLAGAQIGFAIGSGVGAYLDPVKVQGPRLSDASAQTSTVGGTIPFGYGKFVTAGNIIWCDELKEHKKTQRQGKGGGAKTTTYTYTRSYAIAVCAGPIYGYWWIKRNGKKVYTSDPNATSEEKAYSAKWLQKCTLYFGDEKQMPDSTIVAVEGAGNVAPFRGLAYMVVENDDLTDVQGAIAQYEFCVMATPPDVYVTSKPFPVDSNDLIQMTYEPRFAELRQIMQQAYGFDEVSMAYGLRTGQLKDVYNAQRFYENVTLTYELRSATLKSPLRALNPIPDSLTVGYSVTSGSLRRQLIALQPTQEAMSLSYSPVSGTLA